jgi:hypothetical protein
MDSKTARIRALNDEMRQNFAEGIAVMTPVLASSKLGQSRVSHTIRARSLPRSRRRGGARLKAMLS